MCRWKRWIWPGILTVAVLSAFALWSHSAAIEAEVRAGAERRLANADLDWAQVDVDGRDVTVSGTAPREGQEAAALEAVRDGSSVRVARTDLELLPLRTPYTFSAARDGEAVVLEGFVPDAAARSRLIEAIDAALPGSNVDDRTELARGAPETLDERVAFGLSQLSGMQRGRFELRDDDYEIEGAADTFEVYDSITAALRAELPGKMTRGAGEVSPPAISPFTTSLEYDGSVARLSGYASSAESQEALGELVRAALPQAEVTNELRVAAGAPEAFDRQTAAMAAILPLLSRGTIELSDGVLTIGGEARSGEAFERFKTFVSDGLPDVTLATSNVELPSISPYRTAIELKDGALRLSGYAPGVAEREALRRAVAAVLPAMEIVDELELAGGAPSAFSAQMEAVAPLLSSLSEGRLALVDGALDVEGVARDPAAFETALALLEGELPGGTELARQAITAPAVSPYVTGLAYDGTNLRVTGFAPSREAREAVVASLATAAPDAEIMNELAIATGAPEGYEAQLAGAVALIGHLAEGSVSLSDGRLTVDGTARSSEAFEAAMGELAEPAPGTSVASADIRPPRVSPYDVTISLDNGSVGLTGFAPDIETRDGIERSVASALPDADITNDMKIGSGAPEGFAAQIAGAAELSSALAKGEVALSDGALSIRGTARTSAEYETLLERLRAPLAGGATLASARVEPPVAGSYRTSVEIERSAGSVEIVLRGLVPDVQMRGEIEDAVRARLPEAAIANELEIAAGAPADLRERLDSALAYLPDLERGRVEIEDGRLTISGGAMDPEAYERITGRGETLAEGDAVAVSPSKTENYTFAARYDGSKVSLTGFAPDRETRAVIAALVAELLPDAVVENRLAIASGAPEGLQAQIAAALDYLPRLANGEVSVAEGQIAVRGTARSSSDFDEVVGGPSPGSAIGTATLASREILAPPVEEYRFSARTVGDSLILDGTVPDPETREAVVAAAKAAVPQALVEDRLDYASNAPAGFAQAMPAMIRLLARLQDGVVELATDGLRIRGKARSVDDYEAALKALGDTAGDVAVEAEIVPADVDPYTFEARRDAEGVGLSGYVPSDDTRERIVARAEALGGTVDDGLRVAGGAPDEYLEQAENALAVLRQVETGSVRIEGERTVVEGRARDAVAYEAAVAAAGEAEVSGLRPALVTPYSFRARAFEDADGKRIALEGYVPSVAKRTAVIELARGVADGVSVEDRLAVAEGAPKDFDARVADGLAFLARMEDATFTLLDDRDGREGRFAKPGDLEAATARGEDVTGLLPPRVEPYTFAARLEDDRVRLEGYVPDARTRDAITRAAETAFAGRIVQTDVLLADGAPDDFAALAGSAVDLLARLDRGGVELKDGKLAVTGRAKTAEDFAFLSGDEPNSAGIEGDRIAVTPALVSPYSWSATRTADGIRLGGYVPDEETRRRATDAVRALAQGGVEDAQRIGAGAPDGIADIATLAIAELALVEDAEASIVDRALTLRGRAGNEAVRDAIVARLQAARSQGYTVKTEITAPPSLVPGEAVTQATPGADPVADAPKVETATETEPVPEGAGNEEAAEIADMPAAEPESTLPEAIGGTSASELAEEVAEPAEETARVPDAETPEVPAIGTAKSTATEPEDQLAGRATKATAEPSRVSEAEIPDVPKVDTAPAREAQSDDQRSAEAMKPAEEPARVSEAEMPEVPDVDTAPAPASETEDRPALTPNTPEESAGAAAETDGPPAADAATDPKPGPGSNEDEVADATPEIEPRADDEQEGSAPARIEAKPEEEPATSDAAAAEAEPEPDQTQTPSALAKEEAPQVAAVEPKPRPKRPERPACDVDFKAVFEGETILFATNRAIIQGVSHPLLDRIAAAKKKCRDASFEITGHTDSRGSDRFNRRLSEARARAVRDYMIRSGVPAGSIRAVGAGEERPVASNRTRAGRQMNRRIEFTVIE